MTDVGLPVGTKAMLSRSGLQALINSLLTRGYQVLGPTVRDGAIVYDSVSGLGDLPEGWTDRQDAGRYNLQPRDDAALFGYAVGPQSWKRFLHPPTDVLWRAQRTADGFAVIADQPVASKIRLPRGAGLRTACDRHSGPGVHRKGPIRTPPISAGGRIISWSR